MVILIVAMDRNRAIGARGRIPWRLPADLRRFRKLTMGHAVVMGRKTFESLGRPLSGRENIVISRQKGYVAQGCRVVSSLEAGLRGIRGDVFVIGGGEIYEQAMSFANRIYVTEVDTRVSDADTFFPEIDSSQWKCVGEEAHPADDDHAFPFRYLTFDRPARVTQ